MSNRMPVADTVTSSVHARAGTTPTIAHPDRTRLLAGLVIAFALFQLSATALGSDRGQAGIIVGAIVTTAVLAAQRAWFAPTLAAAARTLGLGAPRTAGLLVAGAICVLLLLVVPAFARVAGVNVTIAPHTVGLVPGLFAQGGIAEEVLFRGYLFGHLRRGRSFWRAAGLSMVPFVAVHLLLFATMPLPIAMAALLLAVVVSFPMAHLFELGGMTIWPPALLHFVIQGTVKVVIMEGDAAPAFPLAWMVASAVVPFLVFLVPRPPVA
jgi:membrane protease YdiL (CAAX protease family)